MKYMLDTNICSYIIKHRPKVVLEKFRRIDSDDCCISVVSYAELKYWVVKNHRLHKKSQNLGVPKINEAIINDFISHLNVIEFGSYAAEIYATLRDESASKGKIVGNADLMIAAHAISLDTILVTNNVKDFRSFKKLKIENWLNN